MSAPTVDAELRALIPPLTPEEFSQLERNLMDEGCRDPLVTWCGTLLDGHNRLTICERHGLPYSTSPVELPDKAAAKDWMLANQLGRRNLTPDQFTILLGQRYLEQKKSEGGRSDRDLSGGQGDHPKTAERIAHDHGVSERTVRRAADVVQQLPPEKLDRVQRRETTLTRAKQEVKQEQREQRQAESVRVLPTTPRVEVASCLEWIAGRDPCDLLLTDPPYSTDIDDVESFAWSWLPKALKAVKPSGRAYVFVGAYPAELQAYMTVGRSVKTMSLMNVLVWTYRNTLGPKPTHTYKLNWQAVLYFVGPEAEPLDCQEMLEQFTVQDVSAPDGRQGDRYHEWQKPLALAERFVRHATKPGEVVYDCFAGTGTHLIAAASMGREAFGCDVSDDMVSIAVERGCRRER